MANAVFQNQNVNIISQKFRANGLLQVDVSGNLGGADLITWAFLDNGIKAPIKCCSWRSSLNEEILDGADVGQQITNNRDICFEIRNATINTNISLFFDVQ